MSQAQSQRPAPQEVYRVVYLHAGKNKGTSDHLKQDSYHITLFRQALNLRFANGYDAEPAGNDVSRVETIESLRRGQILGIMIITDSFWFEKAKHRHSDEWMLGPFVYKIGETVKLEQGIAVSGKLGKWTPSKEIHAQVLQQPTVQQKFQEWNERYGSKLYFGKEGIPCALTIHQPFVEAILRGVKKYENRKRPMFPLHPKIKPSPPSPYRTQCRFCPEENDPQMMINTDNGTQYHSPKKLKCTYWAHVKGDKRDRNDSNDRKIRKHKASKSRRAYSASSLSSSESQVSQASNHEANGNPVHGQNCVVFEYGVMYNTRSKPKGTEQDNNPIAIMQNETIPPRRKRKHSDRHQTAVEAAVTSPPTKKQKLSKKAKKNKKPAKSKRETEEHRQEAVATFDEQKWNNMLQEYDIGEDGVLPVRMCAHGTMMQPVKHDENDPHSCDICDDGVPMNWDMFYVCHCDNLTTDWCYDHTRPIEFGASRSWREVEHELKELDNDKVIAIKGKYQRLLKMFKMSETKGHHHKTKRNGDCLEEVQVVAAKFKHEDEREVEVHRGRKIKKKKKKKRDDDNNHGVQVEAPRHDANASPIPTSGLLQPQPFGAITMSQFVASSINPFSANYDAMFKSMHMIEGKRDQLYINKINDSINLVTNGQTPSNVLHHQPITESPKFDFSQFPQNLAPATTNANISARSPVLFAPHTVSNGGTSTTHSNSNNASTSSSNDKPPQPPPHQPPFGASLGQIINATATQY